MHSFPKVALTAVLAISNLVISHVSAHCPRCQKIEEERAKEQAAHPQPAGYYDDQQSLALEDNSTSSSDASTGSGSLKGSSYRTSSEALDNDAEDADDKNLQVGQGVGAADSFNTSSTKNDNKQWPRTQDNKKQGQLSTQSSRVYSRDEQYQNRTNPQARILEEEVIEEDEVLVPIDRSVPIDRTNRFNAQSSKERAGSARQAYSTISAILQTKDLLPTLGGSFTLFLPSNEAFRHLSPGTLQDLFRPENKERLSAFVSSHVVPTKILKTDIKNLQVKTLNGKNLNIRVEGEILTVNGARVLQTEAAGDDGVIYIIDRVLLHSSSNL